MEKDSQTLTHIDETGQPKMVDVGQKAITKRSATARSLVWLPKEVLAQLDGEELYSKKGPVFQTAIIAGTMAAKRTHELIPFCHPLGIESCKFSIGLNEQQEVQIECTVKVTSKTGVEMEALTGVTVAALTVYDMCKALSHEIKIRETTLVAKSGGKRDVGGEGE